MKRVDGKVAIVTGAASGMGEAHARLLACEGAKVVLTDINDESGSAVVAGIGENALFLHHDVTNEDEWKAIIDKTVETFGRLDILVNNAGIMVMASVVDTDLDVWNKVNAINSSGVFLGCKHAIPAMSDSGGGSIINISSVSALSGQAHFAAYSASKGAVMALSKNIALYCKELKNGIRCNSVHPDAVKTPMIAKVSTGKDSDSQEEVDRLSDFLQICEPDDVANLVLFLASDESRYINGAEMLIDNAATITPPLGR